MATKKRNFDEDTPALQFLSEAGSESEREPVSFRNKKKQLRKKEGEIKERYNFMLPPSLYADFQKIAFVERRTMSELVTILISSYRDEHKAELAEYDRLKE